MPIAGTTTPLGHIRERRRRDQGKRVFERRSSSGDHVRMIRKFKGMGVKKVEAILSGEGFGNQNGAARHWLESQEESHADGGGLKLALAAVAVGGICGGLLFFAF